MRAPVLTTSIPGSELVSRGKVRDIWAAGEDNLVLVATDRLSAFDAVLPGGIPDRGIVLTQLSNFWFDRFSERVPNHLIETDAGRFPEPFAGRDELAGRSVLADRLEPIPVECVARGYIAGSGWKEYRERGTACGIPLPAGLSESEKLPEPIFTPAFKASDGHDENISFDRMVEIVGGELAEQLRELTLELYSAAADHAEERGILIADTKFEFGRDADGRTVWMDEALTPDSSRFWPADSYRPGGSQASLDKQYVRDWLREQGWNGEGRPPELPAEVVEETRRRYFDAYRTIVGRELDLPSGS